jgi:cell division protease FtsH
MKEVKTPKKPLAYYYGIVLIVLIVFNLVVTPILMEHQVKETDYGTFMSMIEKKNIGEVEVEDNQIIFTDKDQKNIYLGKEKLRHSLGRPSRSDFVQ